MEQPGVNDRMLAGLITLRSVVQNPAKGHQGSPSQGITHPLLYITNLVFVNYWGNQEFPRTEEGLPPAGRRESTPRYQISVACTTIPALETSFSMSNNKSREDFFYKLFLLKKPNALFTTIHSYIFPDYSQTQLRPWRFPLYPYFQLF